MFAQSSSTFNTRVIIMMSHVLKFSSRKNSKIKFTFEHDFNKIREKEELVSADVIELQEKSQLSGKGLTKNPPSLHYNGEILYGVHPVRLALLQQRRTLFRLFLKKENDSAVPLEKQDRIREIKHLANTLQIPISNIDYRGLKYLVPGVLHQGVCLDASCLPIPEWQENECTDDNQPSQKLPLWLVLDELLDPMNVGGIVRSAYYFGVEKIFVVKGNSCKLSPVVSKASSGALEVMNIHQVKKLERFITIKKSDGWNAISTVAYCEEKIRTTSPVMDIADLKLTKPTILILGNEGKGVSYEVQKLCDIFVSIHPPKHLQSGIDSLNVSVAAGVILHNLSQKLQIHQ